MGHPGPSMQLPKYKCHKEVWALKIRDVELLYDFDAGNRLEGARITPAEAGYAPFTVDAAYVRKHLHDLSKLEIAGGYYVVYEDGYNSFSPAKAFEEGYTRI